MSKRPRVPYTLDSGGIQSLNDNEIRTILRAADELIGTGGRSMLAKILKGSRDKKILEHGLERCPAYGFYKELTLNEISHRVDWMIREDYLQIEYSDRLPVLVFSGKGWAIEEETFSGELYQRFCKALKEEDLELLSGMKTVNRQVVFDVLKKIRASKNREFLPLLEKWKAMEVRKVRERIDSVEKTLGQADREEEPVLRKASKDHWREIMDLIHKTVRELYPNYYPETVTELLCMFYDRIRVQEEISEGDLWALWHRGRIAGIVGLERNRITQLYVLPEDRKKGYGDRILGELERKLAKEYETAEIEAYLPDCRLCESLGYRTIRHEQLSLINDAILVYAVMGKNITREER